MDNSKKNPSIVWFRQDLRIIDQPALSAAIKRNAPIIPVYIWNPQECGKWQAGAASKWWLHHSLLSLEKELDQLGLKLIIRTGASLANLKKIAEESQADAIFWNRCFEPFNLTREAAIQACLQKEGLSIHAFNGSLLYEPWKILNKQNKPFQVFTPFWTHCLNSASSADPLPKPISATTYPEKIRSESIHSLDLLPHVRWDVGLEASWQPGPEGAHNKLKQALKLVIPNYIPNRDRPDLAGTSQLSPHLHFGEISPQQIRQAVQAEKDLDKNQAEAFLRQLGWREFSYYLLYHFPDTTEKPLHQKYSSMPWLENEPALRSWQNGTTGYPIVDAGMRQLWKTGWMHNRVRMIAGSFLVKDLLIHWIEGAKWFWDTLVDADLANNTLGWQWVGGCGADAAPYFRIFNPVLQGEKFDPLGDYVKKWIPELKHLPNKWIHKPWNAPNEVLKQAGVILGETYPYPIVDHHDARLRALEAFRKL
jgi:deoxyribodipyrimidine photo-lyase